MSDEFVIRPLSVETWDAFADLVERSGGMFASCWCTWFTPPCDERGVTAEGNKAIKKRLVEEGRNHAALVFHGDEAIAWAEYGPPTELPNIHHRKQYDAEADLVPDYRITCIFVDKTRRRSGLTLVALQGALDLIAAAGGGVVEGYPHLNPEKKVNASFLYNATQGVYERAGFALVRPKGLKNTVMRREVAPAG